MSAADNLPVAWVVLDEPELGQQLARLLRHIQLPSRQLNAGQLLQDVPIVAGEQPLALVTTGRLWRQASDDWQDHVQQRALRLVLLLDEDDLATPMQGAGCTLVFPLPLDEARFVALLGAIAAPHQSSEARTAPLVQRLLREQSRLHAAIDAHAIVSSTDAAGNIVSVNQKFSEISGYTKHELLGRNHRLLRSGVHDAAFYQQMWRSISRGPDVAAHVCLLRARERHAASVAACSRPSPCRIGHVLAGGICAGGSAASRCRIDDW